MGGGKMKKILLIIMMSGAVAISVNFLSPATLKVLNTIIIIAINFFKIKQCGYS
jgi:hypothetical protein